MDGYRADESVDQKSMACTERWPGEKKELACYDSFEAHVTDTVKASFKRENTELAVIPGGLTSLLQPLDVSLNKPFKDGVRKQWMADGIHKFTVRRFCKRGMPIPSEIIAASFLKCGITNNLDQKMNWFTIQPRTLMNLMI